MDLGFEPGRASGRATRYLLDLSPVDVILFDGFGPTPVHAVWSLKNVTIIAWVGRNDRCGSPSRSDSSEAHWDTEKTVLRHAALGGITSNSTVFFVSRKIDGSPEQRRVEYRPPPPIGFTGATLSRIINPTLPGRRCSAPCAGDFDAASQVLDWKERGALFKLPSVFNQVTGYVRRHLSPKEMLSAMDVPASVLKESTDADHSGWTNELTIPFKARFEIIRLVVAIRTHLADHATTVSTRKALGLHQLTPGPRSRRSQRDTSLGESPPPTVDEGSTPKDTSVAAHLKAARSDDAEVSFQIWDERCRRGCPVMEANARIKVHGSDLLTEKAWSRFLLGVRVWMLRVWKRRVASSFWMWWRGCRITGSFPHKEAMCQRSIESGLAALSHSVDATWWEWERGSAPFFWRYPLEWRVQTRDGLPPRFVGTPPSYFKTQKPPRDLTIRALEKKKVSTVRDRGYLIPLTDIKALLNFFSVSKGSSDIRMVYDGTASGLNEVLFAPWSTGYYGPWGPALTRPTTTSEKCFTTFGSTRNYANTVGLI